MTYDLKKGQFELGIGGLGMADSLFFRDLQIPYIKLSFEDIESHTMHGLLNMPLLTSATPSSSIFSRYDYGSLPASLSSFEYRAQFFANYAYESYTTYQ